MSKERYLITSETGKSNRSKRPIEEEADFGQMKRNNRFNRFSMKGLEKVDIEFALMCIGHNLRKWSKKLLKQLSPDQTTNLNTIIRLFYDQSWINCPYQPLTA